MLFPDFKVDQSDCKSFIFKGITPDYSEDNLGGYGVMNVDADRIMKVEVTLDFASNGLYMFSKIWNETMSPFILRAEDIQFKKSTTGCSDCGTPCGCEDCDNAAPTDVDCRGFLTSFPEGCIRMKYEVYSVDQQTNQYKSEGVRVKLVVNSCHQKTRIIDFADKLTGGQQGAYDFHMPADERFKIQGKLVMAWSKLEMSNFEENVDCNCIDARIKRVRADLDSIKIK